jgi:4'-phosphopantetheinyl transferase
MVGTDRVDGEYTRRDTFIPIWRFPAAAPVLAKGKVHLWRIPLDAQAKPAERQFAVLSEDERARAARFHFPKDRRAYVIAHAALRAILGLYTSREPADVRFELGPYGKPALVDGNGPYFNLTHSGALAVVGLSSDREMGVDVEQLREMSDLESMAARFFTPAEQADLRRFPPAARGRAFLDGWTRKEAVMKALGLGVSQPPESIDVSLEPGNAMLRGLDGRPTPDWTLTPFAPDQGYTGAVAMRGSRPDLSFYDWTDQFLGSVS